MSCHFIFVDYCTDNMCGMYARYLREEEEDRAERERDLEDQDKGEEESRGGAARQKVSSFAGN